MGNAGQRDALTGRPEGMAPVTDGIRIEQWDPADGAGVHACAVILLPELDNL